MISGIDGFGRSMSPHRPLPGIPGEGTGTTPRGGANGSTPYFNSGRMFPIGSSPSSRSSESFSPDVRPGFELLPRKAGHYGGGNATGLNRPRPGSPRPKPRPDP